MPKHRASDSYTMKYDAPNPKLRTFRQIKRDNEIKSELTGETRKREVAKVSLPKFSWEKTE